MAIWLSGMQPQAGVNHSPHAKIYLLQNILRNVLTVAFALRKKNRNDTDRLMKYLTRFGPQSEDVVRRSQRASRQLFGSACSVAL
ncbi:MAG: hypothetical protein BGP09_05725 [Rhizobium sp. 60-20]|nr:MAG: hypothetical protein BGP09_05725 [Rhizobium sp. 60-20]